jgi:hypothetical protein
VHLLPCGRLFLNPFQFIVNPSHYHSTTYSRETEK